MYRSLSGYVSSWNWAAIDSTERNVDLLEVTYSKQYGNTALRLTANGEHSTDVSNNWWNECGRW